MKQCVSSYDHAAPQPDHGKREDTVDGATSYFARVRFTTAKNDCELIEREHCGKVVPR